MHSSNHINTFIHQLLNTFVQQRHHYFSAFSAWMNSSSFSWICRTLSENIIVWLNSMSEKKHFLFTDYWILRNQFSKANNWFQLHWHGTVRRNQWSSFHWYHFLHIVKLINCYKIMRFCRKLNISHKWTIIAYLLSSSAKRTLRPVRSCSFLSLSQPYSSSTSLISFSNLRAEK